ncbi:hypothetical protein TNCV_4917181 [Trichonephila clavipes]|nr:hypothetical protein TNCV_4917181 [Trichonephila clavipes]
MGGNVALTKQRDTKTVKPHRAEYTVKRFITNAKNNDKLKPFSSSRLLGYNARLKYPSYFAYPVYLLGVDWKYTREFIFPKKTPKKISGKVPYRFITIGMHARTTPMRHGLADMLENTGCFTDRSNSDGYSCHQVHFRIDGHVVHRENGRCSGCHLAGYLSSYNRTATRPFPLARSKMKWISTNSAFV